MPRPVWWQQESFAGGINEKPEEAAPNQVRDARNVWAPDGRLETRPGIEPLGIIPWVPAASTNTNETVITEDNSGATPSYTTTATLSNLSSAESGGARTGPDRWYFGFTNVPTDVRSFTTNNVLGSNSNEVKARWEYWNGTSWMPLTVYEATARGRSVAPQHMGYTQGQVYIVPPTDWAETTVNSVESYFMRATLIDTINDPASLAIDAGTVLGLDVITDGVSGSGELLGAAPLRFLGNRYFCWASNTSGRTYFGWMDGMPMTNSVTSRSPGERDPTRLSVISIPQYDEGFMAVGYDIYRLHPEQADASSHDANFSQFKAEVEVAADIVGTIGGVKQEFHPDYVVQDARFPKAKFLEYFHGQIWAANLLNLPYTVKWSGPDPAHKVWPTTSYEVLVEDDDSPITGMKAFGEHLAVFKQDSIWRMVFAGESGLTGLNTYAPTKVPGSIGTVSNDSIVDVDGVLMFLAEDGVYAFDGINKPQKISSPIDSVFDRIAPGARHKAAAVRWKSQDAYMLAVALDGSNVNNHVLVYDHAKGSWWVWDTIQAVSWIALDDVNDNERIYCVDEDGAFFLLTANKVDDNGSTIDDWIQLHRIGYGDFTEKSFRDLRIMGQGQDLTSTNIDLERDDGTGSTSATINWASSNEPKVGDSGFVADGTYNASPTRRDSHKLKIREDCEWLTVKITNDERRKMYLDKVALRVIPRGVR